ncbi:MAG TPA: 4'-phosphopantetheinyl transferase superfamily protein [Ohtaekwangia sp.]|uniref:4'-phosphopantetheinyl transferase family protein n=1 Tax=Ohtaekwangia sp. TaxID=2066019 RepID=UPI002F94E322
MVRILISTVSEIAKTTDFESTCNQLKIPFLGEDSYEFEEKKFTSLIGYLMLQRLLLESPIARNILHTIYREPWGKWKLQAPIDFNISHAGDKVVAVLCDKGIIGVDIEPVRAIEWQVYKDSFTTLEWLQITTATDPTVMFFHLWTKKESLLKAYGFGLQIPLHNVVVEEERGYIKKQDQVMPGYFHALQVPGYAGYICTEAKEENILIEHFVLNGA